MLKGRFFAALVGALVIGLSGVACASVSTSTAGDCVLPAVNFSDTALTKQVGAGLDKSVIISTLDKCKGGKAECSFQIVMAEKANFVKLGVDYDSTLLAIMSNPYTRRAAIESGVFNQYLMLLSIPSMEGGNDVLFRHMMAGDISMAALHTVDYWSSQPEIVKMLNDVRAAYGKSAH